MIPGEFRIISGKKGVGYLSEGVGTLVAGNPTHVLLWTGWFGA